MITQLLPRPLPLTRIGGLVPNPADRRVPHPAGLLLLAASLAVAGCGTADGVSPTPTPSSRPAPESPPAEPPPESAVEPANRPVQTSAAEGPEEPLPHDGPAASASACTLQVHTGAGWVDRTPLPCPSDAGLGLLVAGDVGSAGERLTESTDGMIRLCAERPCDLVLLPGDLLYGPGSVAEQMWDFVWDRSLARVGKPGLGSLGNHEYRHEPDPHLKRKALYAADGRAGFVLPSSSYAVRIRRGDTTLFALAALDSDSVANPGPDMPGLGTAALEVACGEGVPVVAVMHHPPSSQGLHHTHEAHVEQELARVLRERKAAGCGLALVVAGHDHDLQAWPPDCEAAGNVGVVVSGVAARGFRDGGSTHLEPCPATPATGRYHAARPGGGFAHVAVSADGAVAVELYETQAGKMEELSSIRW